MILVRVILILSVLSLPLHTPNLVKKQAIAGKHLK